VSLVPFVHLDVDLSRAEVGDHVVLANAELHHLTRVLRLRPGARIEITDGHGAVAAASLRDDGVEVDSPVGLEPARIPRLVVAQALPKGRKLDEVVRQVTELGADAVIPVQAERSVARPPSERVGKLQTRAQAVARAAAEQARSPWRTTVMPVTTTVSLAERVRAAGTDGLPGDGREALVVAHLDAPALPVVLASLAPLARLAIAIGPEGGWSDAEVAQLRADGALVVGLGGTVLRTEHAAAAALAVAGAVLGRWG
jgi:16S rRNA (uracil1498-N3)-methyltransferase